MRARPTAAGAFLTAAWLAACSAAAPASTVLETTVASTSEPTQASASASQDPLAVCDDGEAPEAALELTIETVSFAFNQERLEGPRHCQPFVIVFTNNDDAQHDIDIRADGILGSLLFDGKLIGRGQVRYEVPGLPAGDHYFYCTEHPGVMNGTLVVSPEG